MGWIGVETVGPGLAQVLIFPKRAESQAPKKKPCPGDAAPMASDQLLGRAKNRKSAAHAKPKGTRQRCIHVPPLANRNQTLRRKMTSALQAIRDRVKYSFHFYVHADPFVA